MVVNRSHLDYGEAGDFLEIAEVQRRNLVTEMQSCRADQQVLERELDTYGLLLTFDAPGQPRDVERHWMHGHVARQPLDELQPSFLLRLGFGAISSVHQFGDGYYRYADFDLALNRFHLFKYFPNGMASAFGGDNDA